MQYGYFDDAAREYVITDPRTPVKWINYVGTLAFGGFIDQTGGSLICKQDPTLNRIVKYLPQLPPADFNGETLYLRIHEASGYQTFSPYFTPTLDRYDRYVLPDSESFRFLPTERTPGIQKIPPHHRRCLWRRVPPLITQRKGFVATLRI